MEVGRKNFNSSAVSSVPEMLLPMGHKNRPGTKLRERRAIIVHWTAAPNQKPENTVGWFMTGQVYGSAQYVIGTRGEALRCVPDDEVAWHCGSTQVDPLSGKVYTDWARDVIGANYCSANSSPNYATIGFEINPIDSAGTFSDESLQTTLGLVREIASRDGYEWVGMHFHVVGWKDCPKLFMNVPGKWLEFARQTGLRYPDHSVKPWKW